MRFSSLFSWSFVTLFLGSQCGTATAQDELITPDSPYVHAMVRPAVGYLRDHHKKPSKDYGEDALIGLAVYNAGLRLGTEPRQLKQDPFLLEILGVVSGKVRLITAQSERTIYAACVSGLLMAEMDHVKYNNEINMVLDFLYERQTAGGGWAYTRDVAEDVSQTQYACLFMWLAKNKKFKVKTEAVERALKFLIKTQRQSGGFPYKVGDNLGDTHSLAAAGNGSIYLLGDALGLHGGDDVNKKRSAIESVLAPSVTLVVAEDKQEKKEKKAPPRFVNGFDAAKGRGDAFFGGRFVANPSAWTYYYLYGFERYASFKERADKVSPDAPNWYVEGAKFLNGTQDANGSWLTKNSPDRVIAHSTSFAILFLVRSTKLLIPVDVDVQEKGMIGLPETGNLIVTNGRVVNKTFNRDYNDVMALLETGKDTDWQALEATFDSLVLSSNKKSKAEQLVTLRNLVVHENAVARKVAVKSISKFRDFDNIKFLIYALSDPEPEVARLANDGLRFISRKFNTKRISEKPNKQEIEAITKFWTDWYLTVEPEGRLLETDDQ